MVKCFTKIIFLIILGELCLQSRQILKIVETLVIPSLTIGKGLKRVRTFFLLSLPNSNRTVIELFGNGWCVPVQRPHRLRTTDLLPSLNLSSDKILKYPLAWPLILSPEFVFVVGIFFVHVLELGFNSFSRCWVLDIVACGKACTSWFGRCLALPRPKYKPCSFINWCPSFFSSFFFFFFFFSIKALILL